MTSRNGQCPLARINHHLPRLTLWLFVAVAAAIVLATTLGGPAAQCVPRVRSGGLERGPVRAGR